VSDVPLLLDTCTFLWLVMNEPISSRATGLLAAASAASVLTFISPISAWEIGMLTAKGRIQLTLAPQRLFSGALQQRGIQLANLTPEILIESCFLPGLPPRDPADRIIAATARNLGCRLITRDRELLDYGEQGHISAVAC
jgi:PIN domain nuclease of toxin-antitoxin system